eukprot:230246_1
MRLSKEHNDILTSLSTNYRTGPQSQQNQQSSNYDAYGGFDPSAYPAAYDLNIISPPLNCPKWACVVLPCINHLPSMKLYQQIIPRDAEVRQGNDWICYDASSLNKGDIVRLSEGDVIPADVCLLSLGSEFVSDYKDPENDNDNDNDNEKNSRGSVPGVIGSTSSELIVDSSNVNGQRPQTISAKDNDNGSGTVEALELYAGSVVLQGEAIVVVTKIGKDTMLASMIAKGEWPPTNTTNATPASQQKGYEEVCQAEAV